MKTPLSKLLEDIQQGEWEKIIYNVKCVYRPKQVHNIMFCTYHAMSTETQKKLVDYLERQCEDVIEAVVTKHRVLIRYKNKL